MTKKKSKAPVIKAKEVVVPDTCFLVIVDEKTFWRMAADNTDTYVIDDGSRLYQYRDEGQVCIIGDKDDGKS